MNSQPNRLEKSLFQISCLLLMIIMTHGLITGLINYPLSKMHLIELMTILISGCFYFWSKCSSEFEYLRMPLLALMAFTLVYFWFRLCGIYGPSGIGAVAFGMVAILISPPGWRVTLLILASLLTITLVYLQFNTSLVYLDVNTYKLLPLDYLVITICLLLIVNKVKSQFEAERQVIFFQKDELEQLNKTLQDALVKNEQTIYQLQSMQQKLIESEKMASVGRLTAGLAHELNNPLNFIGGNVRPIIADLTELKTSLPGHVLLQNQYIFDEIDLLLENISNGTTRVTEIMQNLLKISPRGGTESITFVDLHELILKTGQLLEKTHREIRFRYELKEEAFFKGNATELNQVLLNLIKNAIEATENSTSPQIFIQLRMEEDQWIITIADNGSGIDPEHLHSIFEPFFTTKEEGKGTGLGLYISYGIIQKHKGTIHYEALHPGSAFHIHLPV